MANLTNEDLVQLCRPDDTLCNTLGMEITLVSLNLLSVVINSLHLFILSRISSLRGTPYLRLLQFIAGVDVADGLVCALRASCFPRKLLQSSRPLSAVITVFASLLTVKYYMVMSIAIERVIALAYTMKYKRSLFIRKISLWLSLQIAVVMLESVVHNAVCYNDICINTHYGPNDVSGFWTSKIIITMRIVPSVAIITLMAKVFYELWKMRKLALTNQEKEVVTATKSIMIICTMIVCCLIPPFLSLSLIRNHSAAHHIFNPISLIGFILYSIMNCIVYGWRTKKYRQVVADLFGCCSKSSPTNSSTNGHSRNSDIVATSTSRTTVLSANSYA